MKKALVCGSGGFIGSHLVRRLDNRLIEKSLNWRPTEPLVKGVEKTYKWISGQVQALRGSP